MTNRQFHVPFRLALLFATALAAQPQAIVHQISLPNTMNWCEDSLIRNLFSEINSLRTQRGLPALRSDKLGDKVAELRAVQFANYMATHSTTTPGFNPHQGYDTTAAGVGYNIVSENLAYLSLYPSWIVWSIWQTPLHLAAMLNSQANIAGVSCIMFDGGPFWTYVPGIAGGAAIPTPTPSPAPTPAPTPTPTPPTPPTSGNSTTGALDGEQSKFLALINAYRAQNGAPPLQVSVALQNASQWMSNDMAKRGFGNHVDSLGRSASARMADFGYTYFPKGENIAGGLDDAQGTFDQWKNNCAADASGRCTYPHRMNMLNPSYVVLGIGRAYGPGTVFGWFWTTNFGGFLDRTINQPGTTTPAPTPSNPAPSNPVPAPTPTPSTPVTPGAIPVISSFVANPPFILAGQVSTLSWNTTGATSLTIDVIGNVTGATSRQVTPTRNTTYRLTATNASGSSFAIVTLAVAGNTPAAPAADTQPPSTPSVTAGSASGPNQVNLTWSTATDNVGVTGYQVFRNNTLIANTSSAALTFSDFTPSAASTYSYTVRAFDAASNFSSFSAARTVTTPASPIYNPPTTPAPAPAAPSAPTNSSCAAPATNAFTGCYYNNVTLSGSPSLVRTDRVVDFNWGTGTPAPSVTPLNFSARWQGNFSFQAGAYAFSTLASDGLRLYIDGELILDRWRDQPGYMFNLRRTLTAGQHLVTVEYYQRTGLPLIGVSWQKN